MSYLSQGVTAVGRVLARFASKHDPEETMPTAPRRPHPGAAVEGASKEP